LKEITTVSANLTTLMREVSAASDEQAKGIEQVHSAVSQMNQAVQQAAANAEESSSASQQLAAQAQEMQAAVVELNAVIQGAKAVPVKHFGSTPHSSGKRPTTGGPKRELSFVKGASKSFARVKPSASIKTSHQEPSPEDVIPLDSRSQVAEFH
jgi:methyl-accepting chemotaxis protein